MTNYMTDVQNVFIETIKLIDGEPVNLDRHQERMRRTLAHLGGVANLQSLRSVADKFSNCRGLQKLRVVYGPLGVSNVSCSPYTMRSVKLLKVVDGQGVDYSYKYADRSQIDRLVSLKGACDDVLVVKDGFVTDTSFTNIAICDSGRWLTPRRPLLCGTKRARLLADGVIAESDVTIDDLLRAGGLMLFNAMIEFGELEVDVSAVKF